MDYSKEERLACTDRARHIVDSLTLEEKVSLMSGSMTFEEVRGAIKKKTKEHYNQFPYPGKGNPRRPFLRRSKGRCLRQRQKHLFSGVHAAGRCL